MMSVIYMQNGYYLGSENNLVIQTVMNRKVSFEVWGISSKKIKRSEYLVHGGL